MGKKKNFNSLLSLLLVILMSVQFIIPQRVQAQSCEKEWSCETDNFEAFSEAVSKMMEQDTSFDKSETADEFQTKRLVVKANRCLMDATAVASAGPFENLYVFQYETIEAAKSAYNCFLKMKEVDFVEPDEVVCTQTMGNSEIVSHGALSWGVSSMGLDVALENLTGEALEQEIIVAVIDTGLNEEASEIFKNRVVPGAAYIKPNKRYVADWKMEIYEDDNGHGTGVAGIIAESTPENVKIKPVKCLDYEGLGTEMKVYMGMMHAIRDGVDIINLSCGVEERAESYEEAMREAEEKGITVVVAAGNEAQDVNNVWPACIESVFTVGAVNQELEYTFFTNYGSAIDFVAPGEDIRIVNFKGGSVVESGTSFATPHVTAAISILKCLQPDCTPLGIEYLLNCFAVDLGEEGWDDYYGYGMIDCASLTDENVHRLLNPTGDADEDGKVFLRDARLTLQAALGIVELTEGAFLNADMNRDQKITIADARNVLRIALGIE